MNVEPAMILNLMRAKNQSARRLSQIVFVAGLFSLANLSESVPATGDEPRSQSTSDWSVGACASCHGSPLFLKPDNPDEIWRSAWRIWASQDPHAQAHLSLWNERSQNIVSALAHLDSNRDALRENPIEDASYRAIVNQRCIKCHSTNAADTPVEPIGLNRGGKRQEVLSLSSGVGCFSCHSSNELSTGSGNSWVELHTTQAWAEEQTDRSLSGIRELADHSVRAQLCAECHLGSANRDVNHDLIAAGHPRLVYEYSSLLSRLPRHWSEADNGDFHVQCWSIGQIESAKSSLDLLAFRARSSIDGNGVWPEFAEYNCHNCHHDLQGSWYVANDSPETGLPLWAGWSSPATVAGKEFLDHTEKIRLEMQKLEADAALIGEVATAPAAMPAGIDATTHLTNFLALQPRLNSDELFAFYLAVASSLRDADGSAAESVELRGLMLEFKSILDFPFGEKRATESVEPERLRALMSEIRSSALWILAHQQPRRERLP